jgi:hypothetical protein
MLWSSSEGAEWSWDALGVESVHGKSFFMGYRYRGIRFPNLHSCPRLLYHLFTSWVRPGSSFSLHIIPCGSRRIPTNEVFFFPLPSCRGVYGIVEPVRKVPVRKEIHAQHGGKTDRDQAALER